MDDESYTSASVRLSVGRSVDDDDARGRTGHIATGRTRATVRTDASIART